MDILNMLAGLKDKVLDASHYEILAHAYELQDRNIDQLKTNNDALRESNDLLKEKASSLLSQVEALKIEVASLQKAIPPAPTGYKPKGLAQKIMKLYQQAGTTSFYEAEIKQQTKCYVSIAANSAISKFQNADYFIAMDIGVNGWDSSTFSPR